MYDVHGNTDALEAVLNDPRAADPAETAEFLVIAGLTHQQHYRRAAAGRRMLEEAGWPDEHSIGAALIDPVDPMVVTRIFEGAS